MNGNSSLGRFIRECRQSLGYTSRKVEEMSRSRPGLATISHSNLLAIEKGEHVPTFDKIVTLSHIFNVPTRHFEDRLQRDMLGEPGVSEGTTWAGEMESARAALAEGQHQAALDGFLRAHVIAARELQGAPAEHRAEIAERLAETRLQAASCRRRLGLLRVAKEELEDLLGANGIPASLVVRVNLQLAGVCRELKNHRLALLHAREALGALEPGATETRARVLNTLANILDDHGDTAAALVHYREAMQVFETLGDRRSQALVSRNLGTACFRLKDYASAIRILDDGVRVARETGDRRGLAYGLGNLGRAYYMYGDPALAKVAAREAKDLAQAESYIDVLFVSLYYLWRIAKHEQQASLARVYGERLAVLHRKLETRCEEADQWLQEASPRRVRS